MLIKTFITNKQLFSIFVYQIKWYFQIMFGSILWFDKAGSLNHLYTIYLTKKSL